MHLNEKQRSILNKKMNIHFKQVIKDTFQRVNEDTFKMSKQTYTLNE